MNVTKKGYTVSTDLYPLEHWNELPGYIIVAIYLITEANNNKKGTFCTKY
jgi:hypothetical protein